MRLYYTLADYPYETVEIECAKYGGHSRLQTAYPHVPSDPPQRAISLIRAI